MADGLDEKVKSAVDSLVGAVNGLLATTAFSPAEGQSVGDVTAAAKQHRSSQADLAREALREATDVTGAAAEAIADTVLVLVAEYGAGGPSVLAEVVAILDLEHDNAYGVHRGAED